MSHSTAAEKMARLQALLGEDCVLSPSHQEVETINKDPDGSKQREPPVTERPVRALIETESDGDEPFKLSSQNAIRAQSSVEGPQQGQESTAKLFELQFGELAPKDEEFCPLQILLRYPMNYLSGSIRNDIQTDFFSKKRFYDHTWELFCHYMWSFYIHPPQAISQLAVILVLSRQVNHFLTTINRETGLALKIPGDAIEVGFSVLFSEANIPRPRYLGRATSRTMADDLKSIVPSRAFKPVEEPLTEPGPDDRSLEAFKRKMLLITETDRKKKSAMKDKKRADRHEKQRDWGRFNKRVQRYLGLRDIEDGHLVRAKASLVGSKLVLIIKERAEYDEAVAKILAQDLVQPASVNIQKPAAYACDGSVVFICVDVEAWERNQKIITEIGVATLDTSEISSVAPGCRGENWRRLIRARHFRIQDHRHLENKVFLQGCAENFDFGQSEWISLYDAPRVVGSCFKPPYSKTTSAGEATNTEKRNLVLVGHDTKMDVKFLKDLGYDISNLSNILEHADTATMYRAFMREQNPRALGYILAQLDIAGWNLHNAGNDAVFTLQAMIGIAIKDLEEREERKSRDEITESRVAEAVKDVEEAVRDLQLGWSSEDEAADGGVAGS